MYRIPTRICAVHTYESRPRVGGTVYFFGDRSILKYSRENLSTYRTFPNTMQVKFPRR